MSNNFKEATWDMDVKSRATSLLHSVTDFEFIAVLLTAYQYLSYLAGITVKLQSSTMDIVEAYMQIDGVKHKVYTQAERMAAAVDVEPCRPRSCAQQRHRTDVGTESIE